MKEGLISVMRSSLVGSGILSHPGFGDKDVTGREFVTKHGAALQHSPPGTHTGIHT